MHEDVESILYTEEQIAQRVKEMGLALTEEYADVADEGIVVVAILRGAVVFMTDLARAIKLPIEMDFMVVSSYGNSAQSSGNVKILQDLREDIAGKHVIIAEDVIDTGNTLCKLLKVLEERHPASLEVVAMLRKDIPGQADIPTRHVGFECPNGFVVGYGLDYAERYRNLPYIGILKPEVYQ